MLVLSRRPGETLTIEWPNTIPLIVGIGTVRPETAALTFNALPIGSFVTLDVPGRRERLGMRIDRIVNGEAKLAIIAGPAVKIDRSEIAFNKRTNGPRLKGGL